MALLWRHSLPLRPTWFDLTTYYDTSGRLVFVYSLEKFEDTKETFSKLTDLYTLKFLGYMQVWYCTYCDMGSDGVVRVGC